MGTITLGLADTGASAPGLVGRAWERAVDGFLAVVSAVVVGAGYALPLVLFAGLALLGYRRVRARGAPQRA